MDIGGCPVHAGFPGMNCISQIINSNRNVFYLGFWWHHVDSTTVALLKQFSSRKDHWDETLIYFCPIYVKGSFSHKRRFKMLQKTESPGLTEHGDLFCFWNVTSLLFLFIQLQITCWFKSHVALKIRICENFLCMHPQVLPPPLRTVHIVSNCIIT